MTKDPITRFSISMAGNLVKQLDDMVDASGFANRSQAVSKLVRDRLVEYRAGSGNQDIAGTVTLVYDHHKPKLQGLLTSIQHDHSAQIVSTLHVHLDHDNCLEVLVVTGRARHMKDIADKLTTAKGSNTGRFTVTSTGKEFTS